VKGDEHAWLAYYKEGRVAVPGKLDATHPDQGARPLASGEAKAERPGRQGGNGNGRVGLVDLEAARPCRKKWKRDRGPLPDPDAEAFCRIYARVVLRIKGLAGLTRLVSAKEGVERESA
jgi:hypothetical protein